VARIGVLLDTTVFVDILRRVPEARGFVVGLTEPPAASEVTRAEVIRGLRSSERGVAEALFHDVTWLAVTEPVARHAGELGRRFRRSHVGISIGDLLVAATALQHDLPLATSNTKHFPMFKGLKAPY